MILGVALGFTNYLVDVDFTLRAVDWITATIKSPWIFLLVLNIWLLIVGCLMDIYSAIVIQVPLLVPIALRFGINPIHLGIIFLANLEVGYLTPPVGLAEVGTKGSKSQHRGQEQFHPSRSPQPGLRTAPEIRG